MYTEKPPDIKHILLQQHLKSFIFVRPSTLVTIKRTKGKEEKENKGAGRIASKLVVLNKRFKIIILVTLHVLNA
jgi:hypothetical protein